MKDIDENGYVTGPWSEMDLFDLGNCCRLKEPVWMIAEFLCRDPDDVGAKIDELRKSGEMDRRIAAAAAGAQN